MKRHFVKDHVRRLPGGKVTAVKPHVRGDADPRNAMLGRLQHVDRDTVPTKEEVDELAYWFVHELSNVLTDEEFAEVMRRNQSLGWDQNSVCASHDFCDANMVMEQAFRRAFGRRPTMNSDAEEYGIVDFAYHERDTNLWNAAWSRAKQLRFDHAALHRVAPSQELDGVVPKFPASIGPKLLQTSHMMDHPEVDPSTHRYDSKAMASAVHFDKASLEQAVDRDMNLWMAPASPETRTKYIKLVRQRLDEGMSLREALDTATLDLGDE